MPACTPCATWSGADTQLVAAFASGLVFGLGLILAGMANPAKVQGFLDLFGRWDPSLALAMAGAIAVSLLPFAVARRMRTSVFGGPMGVFRVTVIDKRLVLGSAAFGIGWGLAGFCPGPALVALGTGEPKAFVFAGAMLAGMGLYELLSIRDRIKFDRFVELSRRGAGSAAAGARDDA